MFSLTKLLLPALAILFMSCQAPLVDELADAKLPQLLPSQVSTPPSTLLASYDTSSAVQQPSAAPTTAPTPLAPTATVCGGSGEVVEALFNSPTSGFNRSYLIYLPPCYQMDDRSYPTLYMLHGNSRQHEEWDQLGIDEAADRLILSGAIAPLLIVMPNGSGIGDVTSGGPWSYETVITEELIPHIESTFCADVNRAHRAIGGLSRGGYWAAEIAFRHPTTFASVAIHSGAFVDVMHDITINPIYTATRNDLSGLRIRFDYGEDDWYLAGGLALHEEMQLAEIPHEWSAGAPGGHDDTYWRSQVEPSLRWHAQYWSHSPSDYPKCAN